MDNIRKVSSVEVGMLKGLLKIITDVPRFQMFLVHELFGQAIATPADITVAQWQEFEKKAYYNAAMNDLRVRPEFSAHLGELAEQYRETQLGQMRLPGL